MVRRRSKKEEENELAVREQLRRAWLRWHAEQLEQALAGIHGDVMRRLMAQLEDLRSARALVDLIAGQDWAAVGADTRAVALHEINKAITKVRVRMNPKEPINDAFSGQPLTAFQMIREIITKFPATAGEPSPERLTG